MKHFACTNCEARIFFANVACLNCGLKVGFDADRISMLALQPVAPGSDIFNGAQDNGQGLFRYCANFNHDACNWLVGEGRDGELCKACALNAMIPNLTEPGNLEAWRELERAKKRLIYSLLRFGLPLDASGIGKGRLTFNFVHDSMTGHLDGVITINVMEADAVERERQRQHFDEPYRTLLGHLRHESGHFYWSVLVEGSHRLEEFRSLFGDERQDYSAALARHHADGPVNDWQSHYVSSYASSHPWEDWAETWAHYVHMVDAVETAETEGIEPRAAGIRFGANWPFQPYDAYQTDDFNGLRERWIPLTIALNRLNRSMGHSDFYAFVIPAAAYEKLEFVHRTIKEYQ